MVYRGLTSLSLVGYFLVGAATIVVAALVPEVMKGFGLSHANTGLLFLAQGIGSLLSALTVGALSDMLGRKGLLTGSSLLLGASLCAAAWAPTWGLFMLVFMVVGLARGAVSTLFNAVITDAQSERKGRALNLLHGCYSVGAALAPLLFGWMLDSGQSWRLVLLAAGLPWLGLGLAAALLRFPGATAVGLRRRGLNLRLLGQEVFALLFVVAFLYNGVAWSLLNWMRQFDQVAEATALVSAGMLTLFYVGQALGRFTCAAVAERVGYGRTMLLCALGTAAVYPLVVWGERGVWTAAVFGSGLVLAGLYPSALAVAGRMFPALMGTAAGTLSAAMMLGNTIPPMWTGWIAGRQGFQTALAINGLLVVVLVGVCVYLAWLERRTATAAGEQDTDGKPEMPRVKVEVPAVAEPAVKG